jgi:8-oxo-dGTP diphosphatase
MGAAAVIFGADERVLLVHHTYGALNWEFPGGVSEPAESIEGTVVREVREETGLTAVPERITGIYYEAERDVHHVAFRCRIEGDGDPVPSSPEISECAFWPLDALPRPISDFTVRRLEDALVDASETLPVPIPPRTWLD